MLKMGIIGLGNIAQKAYLPLISKEDIEIHVYTRNPSTLSRIGKKYRFRHLHKTLESIIKSGISGAFVHTSTGSHEAIIEQLLLHGIHVYVDKPLTDSYSSSKRLVLLAKKKKLLLMAGFNRRYAPAYLELKQLENPGLILMQKNRRALPGKVRTFVFDDFIHVIDTLLFLFPHPVDRMTVTGKKKGGLLYHVIVQLTAKDGSAAVGIMNRDSGTVEEILEVSNTIEKKVVRNLFPVMTHRDRHITRKEPDDWTSTLHHRGFEQIVASFLKAAASPSPARHSQDSLVSHQLCEEIVEQLTGRG